MKHTLSHPFELFSLHLHGTSQDFVEILMHLWPRFDVHTCMCVWCVSVLPLSAEETHLSLMKEGEQSRNVVLARISVTLSCLHESVFTPKGNNEVRKRNPADECGCTFKFSIVHNNLPLIYAFMNHPWGFGFIAKAALSEEARHWKIRQTEAEKWRTHHWQSCHSLVYALTG